MGDKSLKSKQRDQKQKDAAKLSSAADAKALNITEGDAVTVKSDTGSVSLTAKVGNRVPQGVVFAPYHFGDGSINNVTDGKAVTYVTVGK
jgi:predicted molibdopterin-dependent oxidoreductase YjgC